jgi:DNA polymerase I
VVLMAKEMPVVVADLIRDEAEALRVLERETCVGLDLETGGLSPRKDPVAVVILRGRECQRTAVLHVRGRISANLARFFAKPGRTFVGHNLASFDLPFLAAAGVDVYNASYWDTLVSECVVASSGRRDVSASLKASLSRRVGVSIKKDADHSGWMNPELVDKQLEYAAGDVQYIFDLMEAHVQQALDEGSTEHMRLEMDIIPVVVRMSANGLPLDVAAFQDFLGKRAVEAEELQGQLWGAFGKEVNLNSHKQVKEAFAATYGIALSSTDIEHLTDLARNSSGGLHASAEALVEWRHAKQNLKVYTDKWVARFLDDGRVRTRFWQCGADTGRFTSSDPNLQQVPKKMRHVFGGLDGHVIVAADYSQIEVRIAADIARDEHLLADIGSDDVHSAVAAGVFGVPLDEVTPEKRRMAKAQTFRLLFGGGAKGLFEEVRNQGSDITLADAQRQVEAFRARYRGLDSMRRKAFAMAGKRGSVVITLPYGMRRVISGPKLTGMRLLNTAVQGAAGVGLKAGLRQCRKLGIDQYLSVVVHDEIVGTVPEREAGDFARYLEQAMLDGMREVTTAPTRAEVKVGSHWRA